MTPLLKILAAYRAPSQTEREKGTYFEELIRTYFRFEASYADLYSEVWLSSDWATRPHADFYATNLSQSVCSHAHCI